MIELMIVVAIIGILAAIAIPAYKDYTIRSQVTEAFNLGAGIQPALVEYYNNTGVFPSQPDQAGLPTPTGISGRYVSQVDGTSQPGIIQARLGTPLVNPAIAGTILSFSAVYTATSGSIKWSCTNPTVTTVPNKYLPQSCRHS